MGFLRANKDAFSWSASDLVGVPRDVIEHHLMVCPNVRPVKQKARRQALEKQAFIAQESRGHKGGALPRMVVLKKCGKERMCIDFIKLNKVCPQDPFPLSHIDQIMDSTTECDLLCFLDAFLGYHQIKMAVEDDDPQVYGINRCPFDK